MKTRWTDQMILAAVRQGQLMTPLALDRAFELIALGYIDADGTWVLTPKGIRLLGDA